MTESVPLKVYDALKADRDDWRDLEHKLRAELQKWAQAFEGRNDWPIHSTRELLFHNQEGK